MREPAAVRSPRSVTAPTRMLECLGRSRMRSLRGTSASERTFGSRRSAKARRKEKTLSNPTSSLVVPPGRRGALIKGC